LPHCTIGLTLQLSEASGFSSTAILSIVSWNAASSPSSPKTMSKIASAYGRFVAAVSVTLGLLHVHNHGLLGNACDNHSRSHSSSLGWQRRLTGQSPGRVPRKHPCSGVVTDSEFR
jgi:hypothetical protein